MNYNLSRPIQLTQAEHAAALDALLYAHGQGLSPVSTLARILDAINRVALHPDTTHNSSTPDDTLTLHTELHTNWHAPQADPITPCTQCGSYLCEHTVPELANATPVSYPPGIRDSAASREAWRAEIAEAKRTMTKEQFADWLNRRVNSAR